MNMRPFVAPTTWSQRKNLANTNSSPHNCGTKPGLEGGGSSTLLPYVRVSVFFVCLKKFPKVEEEGSSSSSRLAFNKWLLLTEKTKKIETLNPKLLCSN